MDYKTLIDALTYHCSVCKSRDCKGHYWELERCKALPEAANAITELLARAEASEKIVDEYAEAARAIALWLSAFCDRTLAYPSMISNAARKISLAFADMEARAEAAEERAEKAERERDTYKADIEFYKEGCHRLSIELDEYEKGGEAWNAL